MVDFTHDPQEYDIIFDIVADHPMSDYLKSLAPGGRYVACAFNPTAPFFGSFLSKSKGNKVSSLIHKPNKQI